MTRKSIIWHSIILAVSLLLLVYAGLRGFQQAGSNLETLYRLRHDASKARDAEIWLAVAWEITDDNKTFLDGVRLAVDQINAGGGILGRPLRCRVFNGEAHAIAREIIADTRFMAVIGHETSAVAVPVSLTYQQGGILFIAPFATHPDLTAHRFSLTLRSVPNDADMVRTLAETIAAKGLTNAVVVNVRDRYGSSLAMLFDGLAYDHGIQISYVESYSPNQIDFRRLAYQIKQHPFDCVVVADYLPKAAHVILQMREQHIKVPFFGADGLDSPQLFDIAGKAAENTYVASSYQVPPGATHEERLTNATSALERRMLEAFGKDRLPDSYAASGYEAVMLYYQAVETAKIAIPIVVASTLKYEGPWQGLSGMITFDEYGNVHDRPVTMKVVRNGRFVNLKKGDPHDTPGDNRDHSR